MSKKITVTIHCEHASCHATASWEDDAPEHKSEGDQGPPHHPGRTPRAGWVLRKDLPWTGQLYEQGHGYCPAHAADAKAKGLTAAYPGEPRQKP